MNHTRIPAVSDRAWSGTRITALVAMMAVAQTGLATQRPPRPLAPQPDLLEVAIEQAGRAQGALACRDDRFHNPVGEAIHLIENAIRNAREYRSTDADRLSRAAALIATQTRRLGELRELRKKMLEAPKKLKKALNRNLLEQAEAIIPPEAPGCDEALRPWREDLLERRARHDSFLKSGDDHLKRGCNDESAKPALENYLAARALNAESSVLPAKLVTARSCVTPVPGSRLGLKIFGYTLLVLALTALTYFGVKAEQRRRRAQQ